MAKRQPYGVTAPLRRPARKFYLILHTPGKGSGGTPQLPEKFYLQTKQIKFFSLFISGTLLFILDKNARHNQIQLYTWKSLA